MSVPLIPRLRRGGPLKANVVCKEKKVKRIAIASLVALLVGCSTSTPDQKENVVTCIGFLPENFVVQHPLSLSGPLIKTEDGLDLIPTLDQFLFYVGDKPDQGRQRPRRLRN